MRYVTYLFGSRYGYAQTLDKRLCKPPVDPAVAYAAGSTGVHPVFRLAVRYRLPQRNVIGSRTPCKTAMSIPFVLVGATTGTAVAALSATEPW